MEYVVEGNYEKFFDIMKSIPDVNKLCHNGFSMLHHASTHGHEKIVEYLISKGHKINWRDEQSGATPIHNAIKNGHSKIVKMLMLNGGEIDTKDFHGKQPLHYAAENGNVELVDLLLSKGHSKIIAMLLRTGADVSAQDNSGKTALHYAAQKGNLEVVELLLSNKYNYFGSVVISKGVDVDVPDQNGSTPFFYSVVGGYFDVAKFLVKKGADINVKNEIGNTPLMASIRNGREDVFDFLISRNADISLTNHQGNDAFLIAAQNGQDHLLKRLLDIGVDINRTNYEGKNGLILSIENNHTKTAQLLIENGIDLDHCDQFGNFPLLLCIIHGKENIFKILLETGANLLISQGENEKVLYLSAQYGNLEIFNKVLERVLEFNPTSKIMESTLLIATKFGHFSIIKELLAKGSSTQIRDENGDTLLHIAALNGYEPIVNHFIDLRVDVNARNDLNETPLHKAAEYGRSTKIVLSLLEHGADLEAEDNNNKNPLNIASKKSQFNVFEILLKNNPENINLRKAMLKATNKFSPKLAKILKNSRKLINRYRSMSDNINKEIHKLENNHSISTVIQQNATGEFLACIPQELLDSLSEIESFEDYRLVLMLHFLTMKMIDGKDNTELIHYLKDQGISVEYLDDSSILKSLYYNYPRVYSTIMKFDSKKREYEETFNGAYYDFSNLIHTFDEYIAPFIEYALLTYSVKYPQHSQDITFTSLVMKRLSKLKILMEMSEEERKEKCKLYDQKATKLSQANEFIVIKRDREKFYRYSLLRDLALRDGFECLHQKPLKEEIIFLEEKLGQFELEQYSLLLKKYEDISDKIDFCKTCINFCEFLSDNVIINR
jgi:ankyrin repeat protein